MYFVGWNDPAWKVTAKNTLASAATQEWVSGLYDGVEAQPRLRHQLCKISNSAIFPAPEPQRFGGISRPSTGECVVW